MMRLFSCLLAISLLFNGCGLFEKEDPDRDDCMTCTASSGAGEPLFIEVCNEQERIDFMSGYSGWNPSCPR